MRTTVLLLALRVSAPAFGKKFVSLAKTPPMGWNSWNRFACDIAGNDIGSMSETTRTILTNLGVITVDQDPLGIQGFPYLKRGALEIWARPLQRGEVALTFLNRGSTPEQLEFAWEEHEIKDDWSKHHYDFKRSRFRVRDLWSKKHRRVVQPFEIGQAPLRIWLSRENPFVSSGVGCYSTLIHALPVPGPNGSWKHPRPRTDAN